MNKTVKHILFLMIPLIYSTNACNAAPPEVVTPTSGPSATSSATATPGLTPTLVATSTPRPQLDEAAFFKALSDEIGRKEIIPDFVTLKISPLFIEKPTIAFRDNKGIVLQLNIFGYPDPKKTKELVAPLAGVGTDVANQFEVTLVGIEIVYHRRQEVNPMLVWAITPPWGEEQIFVTPP